MFVVSLNRKNGDRRFLGRNGLPAARLKEALFYGDEQRALKACNDLAVLSPFLVRDNEIRIHRLIVDIEGEGVDVKIEVFPALYRWDEGYLTDLTEDEEDL